MAKSDHTTSIYAATPELWRLWLGYLRRSEMAREVDGASEGTASGTNPRSDQGYWHLARNSSVQMNAN